MSQWRLPDNLEDLLPAKASKLESIRRVLIDLFESNGYQFIMPSLLEYEDSLRAHGKDLDLDTFKVVDQLSGKMMGMSSDLTTQASRVDAYLVDQNNKENKLCYAGQVLRTNAGSGSSRELFQIGLEYFGSEKLKADIEVQTILIKSLQHLNINKISMDINDLSIYRSIIKKIDLTLTETDDLSKAIMLKDISSAKDILKRFGKNKNIDQLFALFNIYGDSSVLNDLEKLDKNNSLFMESVKNLKIINEKIKRLGADVTFDFSEIRGYQYHKGIIFSAYADGFTSAVAQGGRYDNLNELLGIKRPATGFSLDLRYLINIL
jgi:ATP phosphoribosyltransferase regulatory subunit